MTSSVVLDTFCGYRFVCVCVCVCVSVCLRAGGGGGGGGRVCGGICIRHFLCCCTFLRISGSLTQTLAIWCLELSCWAVLFSNSWVKTV